VGWGAGHSRSTEIVCPLVCPREIEVFCKVMCGMEFVLLSFGSAENAKYINTHMGSRTVSEPTVENPLNPRPQVTCRSDIPTLRQPHH